MHITPKNSKLDVILSIPEPLLWGFEGVKKLLDMLSFARVNLFGEQANALSPGRDVNSHLLFWIATSMVTRIVIIVSRILLMSYIFQIFNRNVLVFSPVFYRWNISFFKYQFQIVTFLFCTPVFKRCNTSCFSCYFSIIFYTLSFNCNVFALRVIICNTLKKKGCAFWNIGKYTVSLPLNQHCFFIVLGSLFFAG